MEESLEEYLVIAGHPHRIDSARQVNFLVCWAILCCFLLFAGWIDFKTGGRTTE